MLASFCSLQAPGSSRAWNIKPEFHKRNSTSGSVSVAAALGSGIVGRRVGLVDCKVVKRWSFPSRSKITIQQHNSRRYAPWIVSSHIAIDPLTVGTAAVLPFYALMILAPNVKLTEKTIESSIPQIILVSLYVYISYLAWRPDMPRLLFTGEFMLPELNGIADLFTSKTFISAAWLHMIAVDFFAARQIFLDGLKNKIQTRHSVALCLLCCPVGILMHLITKLLTISTDEEFRL